MATNPPPALAADVAADRVLRGASRRADYGLDAPGVVRNLLLVAAAGALAFITRLVGLWDLRRWWGIPLLMLISIGAGCLVMGSWMQWYSRVGKIRTRDRVLAGHDWRGDERVLDVGCGRGLYLIGAATRLSAEKGGKAVGVDVWNLSDLSGNASAATQYNAVAEGVADRVELKTADARDLPFEAATFDRVFSCAALHNIYDSAGRTQAVREIARVLKPGGTADVLDIRHTREYADEFRHAGLEVTHTRPWVAPLLIVLTFGALQLGHVIARKALGAALTAR